LSAQVKIATNCVRIIITKLNAMNKNTSTTYQKTLTPEFKNFLKALSYFDDDKLELLSAGKIPPPVVLNRAVYLKHATPEQISGIAKDLAHIHSLSLRRLNVLDMMKYISTDELVAYQREVIESMAILEESEKWIPISLGLPTEQSWQEHAITALLKSNWLRLLMTSESILRPIGVR